MVQRLPTRTDFSGCTLVKDSRGAHQGKRARPCFSYPVGDRSGRGTRMKLARYERDGMAVTALGRTLGGELRLVDLEVALQRAGVSASEYPADMPVSALLSNWTGLSRL